MTPEKNLIKIKELICSSIYINVISILWQAQSRKDRLCKQTLIDKPHATIPISAFWLVPQYSLHGIAEAFMLIGHLEFVYDQAPDSMRSTATALLWTSISLGNYLSTFLVSLIHKFSDGLSGSNWLPDNLNKGKLEYFYWLITLLQVVNLIYYLCCTKFYTFKPIKIRRTENDKYSKKDQIKLATHV